MFHPGGRHPYAVQTHSQEERRSGGSGLGYTLLVGPCHNREYHRADAIHWNHKDLLDSTAIPCDSLDLTLPCCLYRCVFLESLFGNVQIDFNRPGDPRSMVPTSTHISDSYFLLDATDRISSRGLLWSIIVPRFVSTVGGRQNIRISLSGCRTQGTLASAEPLRQLVPGMDRDRGNFASEEEWASVQAMLSQVG